MALSGIRIHITGIVQGVGFRPFVYGLATRLELTGWVRNTSAGVDIELDGPPLTLERFVQALKSEAPPLARLDEIQVESRPPNGFAAFEIVHSEAISGAFQPISPDVSICPDCLREMFDPHDRRYRYPFINCTNCGPRFTIIADIPYDRPNTTMAGFPMCPDCAAEYTDPLDRRFHAQPVACPLCGPHVWLEGNSKFSLSNTVIEKDDAILEAQRLLAQGKIVAIKGLGGFHLACDATNPEAVAELRRRKLRVDKPFALMMPDIATVEQHCFLNPAERDLLESRQRPILILRRKPESGVAPQVAPGQDTIGVMLPYTPLHYLLFAPAPSPLDPRLTTPDSRPSTLDSQPSTLVMTSGNLSEEPIATDNQEARQRLSALADAFLMHDRPIRTRCDDSVARVISIPTSVPASVDPQFNLYSLRRSRGYAPDPVRLPFEADSVLATGSELKNTFCLTRGRYAFLSHHIGDLENYETLQSFLDGIDHFERLFRIRPEAIAYDLHPNYLATRYALQRAEEQGLRALGVQHHHAHIAACLADNGWNAEGMVIGVSFDGTGYGEDGAIWGGEFLVSNYRGFQRGAHLAYTPLPGGDAAVRKPARTALAHLWQAGIDWEPDLPPAAALRLAERSTLRAQLEHKINAPLTSSMGRLFDAAAALSGVRQEVNYEAQAAIEFEALADPGESGAYRFDLQDPGDSSRPIQINPAPLMTEIINDLRSGASVPIIAARFHNGVARMVRQVVEILRERTGITEIALSGGVWQNLTLLEKTLPLLQEAGFKVYLHQQVPPNDGGLSLGQAVIAACQSKLGES